MEIDKEALDRYITGNWGEDQFREVASSWDCGHHDMKYIGEQDGVKMYTCRNCGDLFDEPKGEQVSNHPYEAENDPEGEFINCKWCGKPKGLHEPAPGTIPLVGESGPEPISLPSPDMNIASIRKHVQLVLADAKLENLSLGAQILTNSERVNFRALYAQVQGLGKMMLEILDYLELMGAK